MKKVSKKRDSIIELGMFVDDNLKWSGHLYRKQIGCLTGRLRIGTPNSEMICTLLK